MTIEYLKCRKDLNFEVDFRVNDVIGTTVTKWNVILYTDNGLFSSIIYFVFNYASNAFNLQVVRYLFR